MTLSGLSALSALSAIFGDGDEPIIPESNALQFEDADNSQYLALI